MIRNIIAGQNAADRRKADYERIEKMLAAGMRNKTMKASDQSDATVLFGDLNYRVNLPMDKIKHLVRNEMIKDIIEFDQLCILRKKMEVMHDFTEEEITFAPTFKLSEGGYVITSSRIPSYTDRILYKAKAGVSLKLESYDSNNELKSSDHRPVFAQFTLNVQGEFKPPPIEGGDVLIKRISTEELSFGKSRRAVCTIV